MHPVRPPRRRQAFGSGQQQHQPAPPRNCANPLKQDAALACGEAVMAKHHSGAARQPF